MHEIWLSRSRLHAGRSRIVEELAIESALAGAGWRIYRPQEHSVGDQLETLGTAAELAGFIGSASTPSFSSRTCARR
jgi:capsular polysaccharide biosynthesis protein